MTTDIERGGIDVGGSHEPSYYEIALTNRQVVVAFVILLVCVVAAFLSGVWIGRESTARAQEKMALLARTAATDSADKDKSEGQALQEFKFFADPRHRPAPAGAPATDAAAKPSAGAAANDAASNPGDDGARAPQAPPAPSALASAAAARKDARTARSSNSPAGQQSAAGLAAQAASAAPAAEADVAPAAPESVVRPRPLPDAPAPAASTAKRAAAPAASSTADSGAGAGAGEVVIQVFSSADREQADRVRSTLVDAGFQAFLSPLAKNGQTMYRVRIGPFATRASAESEAEKVRKEQKLDTWITPK
jgi:cell division septation protein DedD